MGQTENSKKKTARCCHIFSSSSVKVNVAIGSSNFCSWAPARDLMRVNSGLWDIQTARVCTVTQGSSGHCKAQMKCVLIRLYRLSFYHHILTNTNLYSPGSFYAFLKLHLISAALRHVTIFLLLGLKNWFFCCIFLLFFLWNLYSESVFCHIMPYWTTLGFYVMFVW